MPETRRRMQTKGRRVTRRRQRGGVTNTGSGEGPNTADPASNAADPALIASAATGSDEGANAAVPGAADTGSGEGHDNNSSDSTNSTYDPDNNWSNSNGSGNSNELESYESGSSNESGYNVSKANAIDSSPIGKFVIENVKTLDDIRDALFALIHHVMSKPKYQIDQSSLKPVIYSNATEKPKGSLIIPQKYVEYVDNLSTEADDKLFYMALMKQYLLKIKERVTKPANPANE